MGTSFHIGTAIAKDDTAVVILSVNDETVEMPPARAIEIGLDLIKAAQGSVDDLMTFKTARAELDMSGEEAVAFLIKVQETRGTELKVGTEDGGVSATHGSGVWYNPATGEMHDADGGTWEPFRLEE